ncbi:MAG: heavy metal translocating P-type ATPase [Nitrospinota bacterium]|nr:heavy metal translocating P-type ATPase [Nitrospinota bacterium]
MENLFCYHCGVPLADKTKYHGAIIGEERYFCCQGCKTVCQVIHDAQLEGFYSKLGDKGTLSPPLELPSHVDIYDIEEVQQEFTATDSDLREVTLLVEGIHCAACVWLIERALDKSDGTVSSQVNLAAKKLRVRWDNNRIKLSEIIRAVGSFGYSAIPYSVSTARENSEKVRRQNLFRIGFAGFAAMNMMWISIALWTGADMGEYRDFFRILGLFIALPTLLYSGYPFLKGSLLGIRSFYLTMDLPIAIGAIATFLYSAYITLFAPESGEVYFDTMVFFLFVIHIGRYMETSSRARASDSTERLLELQPKVATILNNNSEFCVHVKSVNKGDIMLIKPGERIPLDGEVIEGASELDESIVTGESAPVKKFPGSLLVAGSINGNGSLTAKVINTLSENTLTKMALLIDKAQTSKAPTQQTAEKVVPWFIFMTLTLAAGTFLFWYDAGFEKALLTATSVLIITCPCALGLATPMAVSAATGLGSRIGILVKNGASLETVSRANRVVFDKTGALTEGKMSLIEIIPLSISRKELLEITASIESRSEHSIAKAIVTVAEKENLKIDISGVSSFSAQPGFGISGELNKSKIIVGSKEWMVKNGVSLENINSNEHYSKGRTVIFCAIDGKIAGIFILGDPLRNGAQEAMSFLKEKNIPVTLLTGDSREAAEYTVKELGFSRPDDLEIMSEMKPEEKFSVIESYQRNKGETVIMIGDGVNDAPALVKADVGIAVGTGADVSIHSADIVLTGISLANLKRTVILSHLTLGIIRQNIAISIAYNIMFIPMAFMGLITPVFAAFAMPISSLTVIANALRIRENRLK